MPATICNTGVYRIRCLVTGKSYVGSASKSFEQRWKGHRVDLRRGTHHSRHLQRAWNKYGEESFVFEILEWCFPRSCIEREQHWLDGLRVADSRYGYNISPTASSSLGVVHTEETRKNMSKSHEGKTMPPEQREKMVEGVRRAYQDPELLERVADGNRKRVAAETPEQRKIRTRGIGQSELSMEHKAAISAGLRGRKLSLEHCRKISLTQRGRKRSKEFKAKISVANKGKKKSPETIAKMKATKKERCADPAFRAMMSEIVRKQHAKEKAQGVKRKCRVSFVRS